ncbi:unnamed protein product [Darwinula stevensoni]|uniref:CN hydrolase domain-containing protein n=1 Tax=Darwinula stevensoni TaxID=69355 RepID=A0A7R8ZYG4_9CRUS|nr:unnamed protein product [Darwinula stevensoni]CAG0880439.1 unnamed protein product [Darwinula stevensoni]
MHFFPRLDEAEREVKPAGTYRAAVMEHKAVAVGSAADTMDRNLEILERNARIAADRGADLMVFPEYGITSLGLPMEQDKALPFMQDLAAADDLPCLQHNSSWVIRRLSCTARENRLYLVANVAEKESCNGERQSCPADSPYFYNTNVVFDRDGRLITRYRKKNLYLEPLFEEGDGKPVTFQTDFGGKFGLLTCFDIMFSEPFLSLLDENITDLIFPTAWVDSLPLYLGGQVQAGWSYGLGINLLASGYHRPQGGQLGSGIFSHLHGPVAYSYSPDATGRLLLADLPTPSYQQSGSLFSQVIPPLDAFNDSTVHKILSSDLKAFTHQVVEGSQVLACHSDFCCQLNIETPGILDHYKLLAFEGFSNIQNKYKWYYQVCCMVYCSSGTLESCSKLSGTPPATIFDDIQISGNFDTEFVYPSAITHDFQLLKISQDEPTSTYHLREVSNLLSMTVYGRVYQKDG